MTARPPSPPPGRPRGLRRVDRAIQIVEESLTKWGAPVYVRHEMCTTGMW